MARIQVLMLLILSIVVIVVPVHGFVSQVNQHNHASITTRAQQQSSSTTNSQLHAVVDADSVAVARTAFFIWFFGASGGAGIAFGAFPRMYNNVQSIQQLKGIGPTKGGETVGLNILCGYPEDVAIADVKQIVNNKLSVEQIVKKYPIDGNFLSQSGYLTYQAYKLANTDANPLAVRAIFDAFSSSDVCNPNVAQEIINEIKVNPKILAGKVLETKLKGYSAIAVLVFLLLLAGYESFAVHFKNGWFPEWPGFSNLPWSLFDPDIGLTAIPKYWLTDF